VAMRPSHRLDLLLVPEPPDARPIAEARGLLADLVALGVLSADGTAGPRASEWMPGGFARLSVDDPGGVTLYANRQGGFRARCPVDGGNLAPELTTAITAWRAGGPRSLSCPRCGRTHALEEVDGLPAFAFGSLALVTAGAHAAALSPWGLELARSALGPERTVLRRG
jgi:hypothetical protein